jgi:hypothetical protein
VLFAQAPTGTIEGTIVDPTGAAIGGATVRATNDDTNQVRSTTSDATGGFRFSSVPVGTYRLDVTYSGFADVVRRDVVLTIGQTVRLVMSMTPKGVAETVGVSAQPSSPIDVRQTAVTMTIDNERIEELPVRSRDYLHFVLLAPGVAPTPAGGAPPTTSVLGDSGFSFAGLRPRSNMLTIDGLDNNDRYTGASRTELSLETVREFQVVSNGWSAENGGAAGGAINVVTKSGTNTIHGDAFVFGESGRLDALPAFEETGGIKPALTRFRAGGALSGPIVKGRTFFAVAAEREQTDGETASDIDPRVVAVINATLAQRGSPVAPLTSGLFPTKLTETEWSAKLDHQFTSRNSVVARVNGTSRDNTADAFNTDSLSDLSARGSSSIDDTALTVGWTRVLGAHGTNEVRGQAAKRQVDLHTTATQGPGVLIAGVAEFGRPYAGNDSHDQRYLEVGDTVRWSRSAHFISAGVDVMNVNLTGTRTDGATGLVQFRSLAAFVANTPDTTRQTFGASSVDFSSNHIGTFAQDRWTPRSNVTVDAGFRFDVETLPAVLNVTDRQVSPRLGVAWTPATKWLVRAGAGTFADRLVLAAFEPALVLDGTQGFERVNAGGTSIYSVRPGAWHPSSLQASAGIERELTPDLSASVNYLFARGRHLPRTVNVNLPPPTILTTANAPSLGVEDPVPQQFGRPVFGPGRLNPAFDGIFELQPTASSSYHGVTVMLNRRLADELEWSAAYTWSHATDSASDFDEPPENPYDLTAESAASRYDQRHRFVASALFDLPIGDEEDRKPGETPGLWTRVFGNIEMAPIFTLDSGQPINPLTGADDNRTLTLPITARPLGDSRNSLRLPASATFDLRVLKFFDIKPHGKLDLVVEAFNLFNRLNVTALNAVYGPGVTAVSTFGKAIDASQGRRIQFSLDFEF